MQDGDLWSFFLGDHNSVANRALVLVLAFVFFLYLAYFLLAMTKFRFKSVIAMGPNHSKKDGMEMDVLRSKYD